MSRLFLTYKLCLYLFLLLISSSNSSNEEDGAAGVDGEEGAAGVDGEGGAAGVDGEDGAAGVDGEEGAAGVDGEGGAAGVDGEEGAAGVDGEGGAAGVDGEGGAAGVDGEEGAAGECPRFCPEDVRVSRFHPIFKNRVEILQRAFTQALDGIEQMQSDLAGKMAGKMHSGPFAGLTDSPKEVKERINNLRTLLEEELEMAVRVNRRAWNRVKDTHADMMDKNRAPKAPKYPPDLQTELENLISSLEETEKSFEPLVAELETNMARLVNPMSALLLTMAKAGGKDNLAEKLGVLLKSKPNHFVGRVLLKLVVSKMTDTSLGPLPQLLGPSRDLAAGLKERFFQRVINPPTKHRMAVDTFWRTELDTLPAAEVDDVEEATVELVATIIASAKV